MSTTIYATVAHLAQSVTQVAHHTYKFGVEPTVRGCYATLLFLVADLLDATAVGINACLSTSRTISAKRQPGTKAQDSWQHDLLHHEYITDCENDSSYYDPAAQFSAILSCLKLDSIIELCLAVREEQLQHTGREEAPPSAELGRAIAGGYNLAFPVLFSDGTKWLLKIPQRGTAKEFNKGARCTLEAEVGTMIMLRQKTSMPIPEIFAWSSSCNNEVGCPFILMQFIDGVPLYECWYDSLRAPIDTQACRQRILSGIADAMAQLEKFSSTQSGIPIFDITGHLVGSGVSSRVDLRGTWKPTSAEQLEEYGEVYIPSAPASDVQSFYQSLIDPYCPKDFEPYGASVDDTAAILFWLLRQFFSWIPEPTKQDHRPPFVLKHPDADVQNFIVSKDGRLKGIIDWDGVIFQPRDIGYESFPTFLISDWNPASHHWQQDAALQDDPASLPYYRNVYKECMQSALNTVAASKPSTTAPQEQDKLLQRTANSHIIENLCVAVNDVRCTPKILEHLFERLNDVRSIRLGSRTDIELAHTPLHAPVAKLDAERAAPLNIVADEDERKDDGKISSHDAAHLSEDEPACDLGSDCASSSDAGSSDGGSETTDEESDLDGDQIDEHKGCWYDEHNLYTLMFELREGDEGNELLRRLKQDFQALFYFA